MLNYILKPVRHPSFFKKYASKKFMKVSSCASCGACLLIILSTQASTFVRDWAIQRWEESTQVRLADELPSLKALIRASRERAIAAGIDPDALPDGALEFVS